MLSAVPNRLNRFATIAVIPLLVFGAMLATRSGGSEGEPPSADFAGEGLLVIANLHSQDLTIYDFNAGTPPQTLVLPGPPHEMAVLGKRLYITLGRANTLVEVDPAVPAILRSVSLSGHPHGIAIDTDGIHVTQDEAAAVVTLDWSTLVVTDRVPVGDTPHVIATQKGTWFVTDSRDGRVRRIDGKDSMTASAGTLPEALAVIGDIVVAADAEGGMLYAFNSETLELSGTVSLSGRPVRVLAVGSSLLVTRNHAATVTVLSAPSLEVVADVAVGAFPDGICQSPSGRLMAVPSNGDGVVTIIDVATWKAVGTLPAGGGPGACAWIAAD